MSEGRKLALSVVVVLGVILATGAWTFFGLKEADKLTKSIEQKRSQLEEMQAKIAAVPALRQEQQRLAGELEVYETILPNDREINKIFDTLSDYEKQAEVEIRRFTPVRESKVTRNAPQTSYKKLAYELDLVGDYFGLVRFLNLLENHNRFVQVDSLNIKQKSEDNPINEISLKVSTFVYDKKAQPKRTSTARTRAAQRKKQATAPEVPFDLKQELADRYVYRENARRRDPFTNPLTRRINASFTQMQKKRRLTPNQEKIVSGTIDKQLTDVVALIGAGDLDKAEKLLDETYMLMDADFRDPECANKQLGFSRRAQRLRVMLRTARGEELYKVIESMHDKMLEAFNAGDYDEVYRQGDAVKKTLQEILRNVAADQGTKVQGSVYDGMIKALHAGNYDELRRLQKVVRDSTDQQGEGVDDRVIGLGEACHALCRRADARREFAGITINIQGTFWRGSGSERTAAAIVNGQMLIEGDSLQTDALRSGRGRSRDASVPEEKIIVSKIEREKVTFLYKGERLEKYQFEQQ